MEFTLVVKKGEKQFVALCPEVDVVSQGTTIEKAIENIKEAVEVYVEEFGLPSEINGKVLVGHFEVDTVKVASPIRT